MAKEPKHLCKWDKDAIKDDLEKLKTIVVPPRFICRKCARVAKDGDHLCKPVEI